MGSVLKVGEGLITFEGSVTWEEKGSGEGKDSTILEGSEGGETLAITEGSGSAPIDLEDLEKW